MYRLEQTDSHLWRHTKQLADGCLYRTHIYTGRLLCKHYNTRALRKMFRGLQEGHIYMHSCDNPPCVSAMHVYGGTHAENYKDCIDKGRHIQRMSPRKAEIVVMAVVAGFSIREVSKVLRVSERAVIHQCLATQIQLAPRKEELVARKMALKLLRELEQAS